jgi:hypothetical protein
MFAALLGYNPIAHLLGPSGTLARLPARSVAVLTGKQFFPHLISGPFHHGLIIVFTAAAIMSVIGAVISLLRGKQFYYREPGDPGVPLSPATALTAGAGPASPNGQPGASARPRESARPGAGAGPSTSARTAAQRAQTGRPAPDPPD